MVLLIRAIILEKFLKGLLVSYRIMNLNELIINLPNTYKKYIVVRVEDGKMWYWGSWDSLDIAEDNVKIIDGILLTDRGEYV